SVALVPWDPSKAEFVLRLHCQPRARTGWPDPWRQHPLRSRAPRPAAARHKGWIGVPYVGRDAQPRSANKQDCKRQIGQRILAKSIHLQRDKNEIGCENECDVFDRNRAQNKPYAGTKRAANPR